MRHNRFYLLILCLFTNLTLMAQGNVTFEITRGIDNDALKRDMEMHVTNLLVMLNKNCARNSKNLNYKGINIDKSASDCITQLWHFQHICVWEDVKGEEVYISEPVLKFGRNGYQVRNIPVSITANDGSIQNKYSEVCINFDRTGKIVDFNITMSRQQYGEILKNAVDVEDAYNRQILVHWMEQMSTAYHQHDTKWFEQVFSDDALIITGVRRFKRVKTDFGIKNQEKFDYNVKTKGEYLSKLQGIFDSDKNNNLYVKFDDYKFRRHGGNPRYFIVDCTQYWNSVGYNDVGHLFVIWDFKNPDAPQILVRAWTHPDDEKRFTVKDFNLPQ